MTAHGQGVHQFESPSRNIGCEITRTFVRCDIQHHDWISPSTPKRCNGGYGDALAVAVRGRAEFTCYTDSALDGRARPLRYGHSIRLGRMRCTSRPTGMTCLSLRTGHGFDLSRESYRRF